MKTLLILMLGEQLKTYVICVCPLINQLISVLKSSLRLFADDALLHGVIANEEAGSQQQDDLRQLEMWQCKWKMVFNRSKWKTICIFTKKVSSQRQSVFLWNRTRKG